MTEPHEPIRSVRRATTVRRNDDRVTPLELFFDLVFVLAITQCTALMADDLSWGGLTRGVLVLGVLWWAWVGYAWLTSVVNPEEGLVRVAIFAAIAALLVTSLAVPDVFGDTGLIFAIAYGVVRFGQISLMLISARSDPAMRRSVLSGLLPSTAIGTSLLGVASTTAGDAQTGIWAAALLLDMLGPYLFGSEGWKIVPAHFAERHGLVFIIALGESIVAIGVGADANLASGVIVAAIFGAALAATMWWAYFDVVAVVAERNLSTATPGKQQNEIARDSYSLIHFPMIAGVVLIALGLKKTLGDVGSPLKPQSAAALVGGLAIYLLAHVAFRYRNIRTINRQRLIVAAGLLIFAPFADEPTSLATLAIVTTAMVALICFEAIRYARQRDTIRHGHTHP